MTFPLMIGASGANRRRITPGGLILLGSETRSISGSYSVSSTGSYVPWATLEHRIGETLINGSDNTRFDMPTGAEYVVARCRLRSSVFNDNYVQLRCDKNTVDQSNFVQLYTQGWYPMQMTAILPVVPGDYIQFRASTNDVSSQAITTGRECWVTVEAYRT